MKKEDKMKIIKIIITVALIALLIFSISSCKKEKIVINDKPIIINTIDSTHIKDSIQNYKDSIYYNTQRHLTLIMTGTFQSYTIINQYHKINIDEDFNQNGTLIIELDTYNGSIITLNSFKHNNEQVNVIIKDKDTNTEIGRIGYGSVSLEYTVK